MFSSKPPLTVAVVDDDEAVRDALGNLLASLDLGVATFASAEEFLASPASVGAACLITDVQMPGMSGLDLQRHLTTNGSRMPVILITAFPRDHVRQQAEAEGAFGFFAKPFEGRLMIDCIERALAGKEEQR
jgi:FixJ family two-component response regulator